MVPGPKKAAILKSCDDEAADRLRCRGESRRDGVLRQGKTCGFSEPNIELIAAADRVSFVEFLSHTCSSTLAGLGSKFALASRVRGESDMDNTPPVLVRFG